MNMTKKICSFKCRNNIQFDRSSNRNKKIETFFWKQMKWPWFLKLWLNWEKWMVMTPNCQTKMKIINPKLICWISSQAKFTPCFPFLLIFLIRIVDNNNKRKINNLRGRRSHRLSRTVVIKQKYTQTQIRRY